MTYTELEAKLRDNHFYPEQEVVQKKDSRKITALHLNVFSFARAEIIESKLREVLPGVNYTATFMPNHNYISIQLK